MKKSECKFENNPDLEIKSFVGQAKLIARSALYVGDGLKTGVCLFVCLSVCVIFWRFLRAAYGGVTWKNSAAEPWWFDRSKIPVGNKNLIKDD